MVSNIAASYVIKKCVKVDKQIHIYYYWSPANSNTTLKNFDATKDSYFSFIEFSMGFHKAVIEIEIRGQSCFTKSVIEFEFLE